MKGERDILGEKGLSRNGGGKVDRKKCRQGRIDINEGDMKKTYGNILFCKIIVQEE